eukprot:scaffold23799_cov74-Phaeocystis_antarctica.AAC.2
MHAGGHTYGRNSSACLRAGLPMHAGGHAYGPTQVHAYGPVYQCTPEGTPTGQLKCMPRGLLQLHAGGHAYGPTQ